jgi:hypothetical protein
MKCRYFRGTMTSWEALFEQAAEFATRVGVDHVVSISHACAGADGTVAVWYWADEDGEASGV